MLLRYLNFLFVICVLFLFTGCEKGKNDPVPTPVPVNPLPTPDSTSSQEIIFAETYPASANDIIIAKVSKGADTLFYLGSTDESGNVKSLNGYIFYNALKKQSIKTVVDKITHSITISSVQDNSTIPSFYLEITPFNDSLIQTTCYEVIKENLVRKILFEKISEKQFSPNLRTENISDENILEGKNFERKVQELQIEVMNSSHQYGIIKILTDLQESINNGDIKTSIDALIRDLIEQGKNASSFFENVLTGIGSAVKKIGSRLSSLIQKPDIYKAWEILDRFEIEAVSGDNQTVIYGQSLKDPLIAKLTFDGSPAANQTVVIKAKTSFYKYLEKVVTSDANGIVSLPSFETSIENENSGVEKLEIVFYKGGWISKNTSFTINFKKRPRLTLVKEESTDNQKGEVGGILPKALQVKVIRDDGEIGNGILVKWLRDGSNNDYYSSTSGNATTQYNPLVPEDSPAKVKVEIVPSEEYVVLNEVEFTIDKVPSFNYQGTWIINSFMLNATNELGFSERIIFNSRGISTSYEKRFYENGSAEPWESWEHIWSIKFINDELILTDNYGYNYRFKVNQTSDSNFDGIGNVGLVGIDMEGEYLHQTLVRE
ncbi:hypothetical protein [Sporocytophaga myxococcoides]|uniref:hypothetical protein n=1 Tax=Sporocytophaga myxococcoides TaxID=153721 RepID=UPI00041E69F0|nr:hypothetical protein [Sporocytophaga myxococcoides]